MSGDDPKTTHEKLEEFGQAVDRLKAAIRAERADLFHFVAGVWVAVLVVTLVLGLWVRGWCRLLRARAHHTA